MTLHVSDSISVLHQESSTVHTEILTGYADCLLAGSQPNLYDIDLLLCVQCQTPDDEQRKCPKHVESYSKNKFEKLVLLVGLIIRIYHDARSSECQMRCKVQTDIKDKTTVTVDQQLSVLRSIQNTESIVWGKGRISGS